MNKYIDADKLISEIDNRLMSVNLEKLGNNGSHRVWSYNDVKDIISSLQQEQPQVADASKMEKPEADLEKELNQWRHKHFKGKRDGGYYGEYLERESQLDIARHFYELGQKRNGQ